MQRLKLDLRGSVEGQWRGSSGEQHTFSGTFKQPGDRKKTKYPAVLPKVSPVIERGVKEANEVITSLRVEANFYCCCYLIKHICPTHGSVYCSPLVTRGYGSVWLSVQQSHRKV